MMGETDLGKLIKQMKPRQNDGEYVFCNCETKEEAYKLSPLGFFQEQEGVTVILPRAHADEVQLTYSTIMAWITLEIHSSLEAVGLTAAVSAALAKENISCNVVAAFYHDHLFVPIAHGPRAIEALLKLTGSNLE